jgi:YjjG family noncanonical pyrimidine nucleotidase
MGYDKENLDQGVLHIMAKYDYVLLDADNTLLDFDDSERWALGALLDTYGYPTTSESFAVYHRINRALWNAFEKGELAQEQVISRRFQYFMEEMGGNHDPVVMNQDYMKKLAQKGALLPGAEVFCRQLTPYCTLAIVTNGTAEVQRKRLLVSSILGYFSHVFISAEIGYQKPAHEFFDIVFKELSIKDRSRVVMVGDSLTSDIQGGLNAGIDTIWYNPKGRPTGTVKPTWEVGNYAAAASLILEPEEQKEATGICTNC